MPSILLPLVGIVETLAISAPTVVDGVLGRVTIAKCDERLRRWARRLLDQAGATRSAGSLAHVPPDEVFVVMSNHRSLYDVPALIEAYPRTLRMVAKSELFRVPVWGPAMRESGFVPIERNNGAKAKEGLDIAKARLSQGINIWIAPEGTRSRTGELGKFKTGGFRLAAAAEVRILPVAIRGTGKYFTGRRLSGQPRREGRDLVRFPVDPAEYKNGGRAELIRVVRHAIEEMLVATRFECPPPRVLHTRP